MIYDRACVTNLCATERVGVDTNDKLHIDVIFTEGCKVTTSVTKQRNRVCVRTNKLTDKQLPYTRCACARRVIMHGKALHKDRYGKALHKDRYGKALHKGVEMDTARY